MKRRVLGYQLIQEMSELFAYQFRVGVGSKQYIGQWSAIAPLTVVRILFHPCFPANQIIEPAGNIGREVGEHGCHDKVFAVVQLYCFSHSCMDTTKKEFGSLF